MGGGRTWWARVPTHGAQTFPSHLRSPGGAQSPVTGKVTSVRARYVGPDTEKHTRSFGDKMTAEAGLNDERILVDRGEWTPPKVRELEARLAQQRSITLREWARRSIEGKRL